MHGNAITPFFAARGPRPVIAASLLGVTLSAALHGAEPTHRQHGAHAHGEGILEVAVDGQDLLVSFRIPAVNVVGFEHAPADDAQRRRVAEARERFLDGARLLVPSAAAECRLVDAEAALGARADDGAPRARAETDGHGHGHDDARRHAEAAHGSPAQGGDMHSELHAEYLFRCGRPDALAALDVRLLDVLLDVRAVEAHVVTPMYQGAAELSPAQTSLRLVR